MIDIPTDMRSTRQFRTTLGHKTCAAFFDERNTRFGTVRCNSMFFLQTFWSKTKLLISLGATSSVGANSLSYSFETHPQRRRGCITFFSFNQILKSITKRKKWLITTQVLVNYGYNLDSAPMWYMKEYVRAREDHERKEKSLDWKIYPLSTLFSINSVT